MSATLAAAALLMGLAGAPHCAVMCGAACGGVAGAQGSPVAPWRFQAGRLAGYASAGAVAAASVQTLGWASNQAAALRPVWVLFHLAVLAWGLTLLVLARQPALVSGFGRSAWEKVRRIAAGAKAPFTIGVAWIFMPCGLLWSALLVASLANGPAQGALTMVAFAASSSLGLVLGPALFRHLRRWGNSLGREWGTRAAGLLLAATAIGALWLDLADRIAQWCA